VLVVLSILMVIVLAVGAVGVHHLNLVNADYYSTASLYAAEAGITAAIRELNDNNNWTSGFSNVPFSSETTSRYTVTLTNNLAGVTAVTAGDGTSVPGGYAYLVSVGTSRGRYPRRVRAMVTAVSEFKYAIATGGNAEFRGATTLNGNVKASGHLTFRGVTAIVPSNGQGRLLSGGNIYNDGNVTLSLGQDARARGTISDPTKILGTTTIVQNDTSPDTAPFVADGRIVNNSTTGAEVMPNPRLDQLLASAVDHGAQTEYSAGQELDLGGQVHYFPNGIHFCAGSRITGQGTIVVGGGNRAEFDIVLNQTMNIVALDSSGKGTAGDASVRFNALATVNGLVYSQGAVEAAGILSVTGRLIAYGTRGTLYHAGNLNVAYAPWGIYCPGWDNFFAGGTRPMQVTSWQRF
jgi:hypothetical protein